MKYRITTDIEIEGDNTTILSTLMTPITKENVDSAQLQGKQEVQQIIQHSIDKIPAPVGQQSSSGKSDWFRGTSWGN